MARVVVGVFPDRVSAEHAIVDLKDAGFDAGRMGFIMRDKQEAQEAANATGAHAGTGAVTGGILGAGIGAILAATGTFVIPGIGPFISAGILATAIAGGAAGAIVGSLVGLGIPKEEAEYYQSRVEQGSVLLTVDPEGREVEARELLLRNGAEDTWRTSPWQVANTQQTGALGTTAGSALAGTPDAYAASPTALSSAGMDSDRVRLNDQPMRSREDVLYGTGADRGAAGLASEAGATHGMPPRTAPLIDRDLERERGGRDRIAPGETPAQIEDVTYRDDQALGAQGEPLVGRGTDLQHGPTMDPESERIPPTERDLTARDRAHAREGEQPLDTRDLPPERL